MVLVSVIMASYNHELYIADAIESVLNQNSPDLELIIVDDCSKDNSKKIIQAYQKRDHRVKAFFHHENQGIARTANDALKAAEGRYISFIGSDDLWVPTKLEQQLKVLADHGDAVVWSEGDIIDADGASTGQKFTDFNARCGKPTSGRIYREIINENYIFGQSLLFKREFAAGLWFNSDLKYLCDYQFFVDLAYEHEFLFIPESLAKYRIHGKNTICRDEEGWLVDRILLRGYFLQRYGGQLSRHLRGSLYLKIGEAYAGLGYKKIAHECFLRALRTDFLSKESLLYLAHASGSSGRVHRLLFQAYQKVSGRFI
jgi:glycosyltransferase involved in cell wall biosynthesis